MLASDSVPVFLGASLTGIVIGLLTLQSKRVTLQPVVSAVKLPVQSYNKWLSHWEPPFEAMSEAQMLFHRVPILCVIYAQSSQQVRSVASTWSRHCNHATFLGSIRDDYVPIDAMPGQWASSSGACHTVHYIWNQFGRQWPQWVLLVDDQTFAVIENLRRYLAPLNSSDVYYLGHAMHDSKGFYNILSAGIVLSQGALDVSKLSCMRNVGSNAAGALDKTLGQLLRGGHPSLRPIDTRDSNSRARFIPFSAEKLLIPGSVSYFNSYWRWSLFLSPEVSCFCSARLALSANAVFTHRSQGANCCSPRAITFHGIDPVDMFFMEYLVQRVDTKDPSRVASFPTGIALPDKQIPLRVHPLMDGKAFVKPFGIQRVT